MFIYIQCKLRTAVKNKKRNKAELDRMLAFLSDRDIFNSDFGINVTHSPVTVNMRNVILNS